MKQNYSLHFCDGVYYLVNSNVNPLWWIVLITKCNCYRINRWKFLLFRPPSIKIKKRDRKAVKSGSKLPPVVPGAPNYFTNTPD